jgi:membrane protease YdiL (CAAX protease family)
MKDGSIKQSWDGFSMNELQETPEVKEPPRQRPVLGCVFSFSAFTLWIIGTVLVQFAFMIFRGQNYAVGLDLAIAEFAYTTIFGLAALYLIDRDKALITLGLVYTGLTIRDSVIGLIWGVAGVGIAIGVIALGSDVSFVSGPPYQSGSEMVGTFSWPVAILTFIFYAGEEEVLARGILYPIMRRSVGIAWALFLSSFAFSALHLFNPSFALIPFLDIFLAGLLLALLRELTGNLWLAWGAHFGWNFALIVSGVPVSGMIVRLNPQNWHLVSSGQDWLTGGGFGPEGGMSGIIADSVMILVAVYLIVLRRWKQRNTSLNMNTIESDGSP